MKRNARPWRGSATGALVAGVLATTLCIPAGGSASAKAPPKATGQPRVAGTPIEGTRLTARNGPWSGTTPFSFAYRWLRCDTSGGGVNGVNCSAISGATGKTYLLRGADVGHRLRVRVTATNAEGSATAVSNATEVVQAAATAGPPRNTAPPTISGTPQVGQTLTANAGSWVGAQPFTFSYRWRRCDRTGGSCSDISSATAQTYVMTT